VFICPRMDDSGVKTQKKEIIISHRNENSPNIQ